MGKTRDQEGHRNQFTETPPRTWGRLVVYVADGDVSRNTPTDVGKTGPAPTTSPLPWETPPRTWGRRHNHAGRGAFGGNTPTDVGKTRCCCSCSSANWKHPHGRGEDPIQSRPRFPTPRNTPTDVGKTESGSRCRPKSWKHPHGRGEDWRVRRSTSLASETPPRTWGRPVDQVVDETACGNTPTDVGKTARFRHPRSRPRKHPHGRGEDGKSQGCGRPWPETPPRTWGRPRPWTSEFFDQWKHPHGRGEDFLEG